MFNILNQWENDLLEYGIIRLNLKDYVYFRENTICSYKSKFDTESGIYIVEMRLEYD